MKRVIIAGHGNFATGIYSSAKIIVGEHDFVHCLDCYVDEKQDVEKEIENLITSFDSDDEIICLTDLFGGSVNNNFMRYLGREKFTLITGTNLNLLLNVILNIEENVNVLDRFLEEAKLGVKKCVIEIDEENEEF